MPRANKITPRRLTRNVSLDSGQDPRILEYASVLAHAVDTFGSRVKAESWLNRENRIFNNRSPLQILTHDPQAVEQELIRIDHGMVA